MIKRFWGRWWHGNRSRLCDTDGGPINSVLDAFEHKRKERIRGDAKQEIHVDHQCATFTARHQRAEMDSKVFSGGSRLQSVQRIVPRYPRVVWLDEAARVLKLPRYCATTSKAMVVRVSPWKGMVPCHM